ncbi:MAG TPA: pyridoxal phosphate-dependent aminotransferase [Thermoanaerobaculia bacterium]|nr:pyridoxal phosphate-dependent aminotransferase [Thermoanaerobaculia bacterium]
MKGSVYMRWAKEHAAARYNLANSGILGCETADLEFGPADILVNGPNRDGYPPVLEAIASLYGVAPEQVVPGEGTSGANFLAFAGLLDPGDEVLVEQPTYEPLLAALELVGARVKRFARRFEDGWRIDFDSLRAQVSDRTRLVVITNPHNPSGVALPPEEIAAVGEIAGGAYVLVDEVYRDILFEDAPPSHIHLGPRFLATSSLTKSYGLSGLRCGWVLASLDVADRLRRVRDCMGAVGSVPSDGLAVAAFRQLPRLAERTRTLLEPNQKLIREFLEEHSDELDCVLPARTMMVFPRLRKEEDSQPLHDRLRRLETSIVPGRFFESPRHFRLGFAVRPDDVATGLRHLSAALRQPD